MHASNAVEAIAMAMLTVRNLYEEVATRDNSPFDAAGVTVINPWAKA